jgi:cell pole-organizing protein PopZ
METQGKGTSLAQDMDMGEPRPYLKQETDSLVDEEDKGGGVEQLAHKAQQEAAKIADEARQQVMTQLSRQKERAANTLSNVGSAIRQAGKDPGQLGQTPVAPFTTQAAEQVEKAAVYLRRRDITALGVEIERFARTRSPMFVACALATGWLGARFLKSRMPVDSRRSVNYTTSMFTRPS